MEECIVTVPEDFNKPGFDVLCGRIGCRTHYIHNVMATATGPMSDVEIGKRAERLARLGGYACKPNTFSAHITQNHLVSMRDKPGRGFAEQVVDNHWQLTEQARQRIADTLGQQSRDCPLPSDALDDLDAHKEEYNDITEKDAIVKTRIGQDKFREDLVNRWQCCAVTSCRAISVLRASHIKPWHLCTNDERLDVDNGLLLTPNLDALFDTGLVSFDD